MSTTPQDIEKKFPEVYGYSIKKERKEQVTIKGISLEIKKYTTTLKTGGIRVSLIDNTSEFFLKYNEYLASIESFRPAEEKAMNMWSFTTLCTADPSLEEMGGAGFYVYQNHLVFNEEEKSAPPIDRLTKFIEHYKKKFGIRTRLKEDDFSDLDVLERTTENE